MGAGQQWGEDIGGVRTTVGEDDSEYDHCHHIYQIHAALQGRLSSPGPPSGHWPWSSLLVSSKATDRAARLLGPSQDDTPC